MEPVLIMPCLDMKEGRVVKGVNFVDIKDAGDPVENAAFYQEEGADELAMLDIAATLETGRHASNGSAVSPRSSMFPLRLGAASAAWRTSK